MPTKTPVEKKMAVLQMTKEKKDILFGRFSTEVENKTKVVAWEEILLKSKSLQMVTNQRDWTYVRDNLFGVWKSRALEKRDNSKKTGTAGGKKRKLDESEWYILKNIIGEESPVIDGLPIGESHCPAASVETDDVFEIVELTYPIPNEPPRKIRKKAVVEKESSEKQRQLR